MMPTLPASLRPFAPHARTVLLRPYRALAATIVPDLGLRLIFPSGAPPARFALTNPLFQAARLGRRAILITVARGAHKRYCGNAFMDWQAFYVSLLVCTSLSGRHYMSDILFTRPPPPKMVPPPRLVHSSPWARAWAYAAFGPPPQVVIRKRVVVARGARTIALRVRRLLLMPGEQVLGFALSGVKGPLGPIHGAALYRGRHKWRRIPATLSCRPPTPSRQTACALALVPPARHVRRWHLVVLTAIGPVRLSW